MSREYWEKEEPIGKIDCTRTDCENDLHSFRRKRLERGKSFRIENCINCGADIIDWDRLNVLDIHDLKFTINSLQNEWVRSYYWYRKLDEKAVKWVQKRDLGEIQEWTINRLDKQLVPHCNEIFRDGWQTPYDGNIVYYAQHATGTCCRRCVQEWYDIERERKLTEGETEYFYQLIMHYIENKIPRVK